ncbi:MAG TPA: hypothetical protein VN541_10170 [Tepidisphaeraceae bacterium]|nr:hypothetical protein [Tepidisphaeraceae bacterium]
MATNHRFLATDADLALVLDWFKNAGSKATYVDRPDAVILHFHNLGPLTSSAEGGIDQARSPLVWIVKPKLVRSCLWTAGEVTFTGTPLATSFPELQKLNRRLSRWFHAFPSIYDDRQAGESKWSYFLEGSIKNWDGPLFALPAAYNALRKGQYFIDHRDNGEFVDRISRQLRLRGVTVDGE